MSIIKILPESLVNQIAAGEVIERPLSVVKELVENSIDAKATRITVEVKDGGKSFIKVSDNGVGMNRDDLQMALTRHATSKISEESDLWKISTMGFRGEALASIASVSKLIIKSRQENSISGNQIECEGGEVLIIKDVGMEQGTHISVFDLFFNTPARQKYLKQDSTEFNHIISTLNTIVLANPGIAFKLIHNDKIVFDLPKVTDLKSRISDVFGMATADAMINVFYGGSAFQIDGFIGKPVISRSSNQHQYFFVNGRYIQHFVLANTIKSAFHSMLMENKKPVFIINIKIDPSLVDVNVHPRKLEVRFEDQQTIIKTIYSCVKSALEKTNLAPKAFTESQRYMSDSFPVQSSNTSLDFEKAIGFSDFRRNISQKIIYDEPKESSFNTAIAQIANSYIIAKNNEGLVLIDQHAAHERVRYEELMDQFENQKKSIQPLLVPLQIEFSSEEMGFINDNAEVFSKLGFEIEPFGGNTFVVHAVPSFFSNEDIDSVIRGVLDDILNEKNPTKLHGKTEDIINYMSCRSAIKFGKSLTLDEMQGLIEQMEKLKRPYTCPHGRPTMINLSLGELEKMFGRK
jgi:DNA mismatch repair protein MutL